ncbi:hypothetical protein ACH57_08685, partial [Salmonella enterica subsp. enterica serovar Typhimurium]
IYRWVQRYAPEMEKRLRWYWRNPSDLCPWHMDEKPNQRPKGLHLDKLETLNIFGVRASYMAAFKDYLKEEGITPSDEIIELDFPTQPNLPTKKLKTLALKDGYKDNQKLGFKRTHYPWLYEIPAEFDGKIKTPGILLLALLSCLLLPAPSLGLTLAQKLVETFHMMDLNQLYTVLFCLWFLALGAIEYLVLRWVWRRWFSLER